MQLEDPTPPEALPCSVHTFVRPLERFPPGFEAKARGNGKGVITPLQSERALLNNLLRAFLLPLPSPHSLICFTESKSIPLFQ